MNTAPGQLHTLYNAASWALSVYDLLNVCVTVTQHSLTSLCVSARWLTCESLSFMYIALC